MPITTRGQAVFLAAMAAASLWACGKHRQPPRAPYLPLADVEHSFGKLVTAGNHPSQQQSGTGERLGLFQDTDGSVWGLPLIVANGGAILACAPPELRDAKVTDTFPSGSTIVGATTAPTGWRGGTGDLELLMRQADGLIRWQTVHGSQLANGPACWAPALPGPPQQLSYYRIVPAAR